MTPEELFLLHKDDVRFNTSYPLRPQDWARYRTDVPLSFADEDRLSFYIHIPFCKSLCRFCEYVKYPIPDEPTQVRYLEIVDRDIANFINTLPQTAILKGFDIGGGTPTALSHKALSRLLLIMNDHADMLGVSSDFVGSIEASFSTTDKEKIELIARYGRYIKRISFGLQNVSEKWLNSQNRTNGSRHQIVETIEDCRKAGIRIVNLDLIYGFAGQRLEDFKSTIEFLFQIMPEHLTLYELRCNMLNDKSHASAEDCFEQYSYLYEAITSLGYTGYFGCNTFSLIGDDGVSSYLHHRMIPNGSYKGFGISAQSKSHQGIAYNIGKHHLSLEQCLGKGTFEINGDYYRLPQEELAAKYIAICGYCGQFSIAKLSEITNHDYSMELQFLKKNGFLNISNDLITITPKGFRYYGAVYSLFFPPRFDDTHN